MADRKATIRLDIKTDGFKRGMRDAEKSADDFGSKSGSSIKQGMETGARAGFDAVKGMFNGIKSLAGTLTGLLGGIGFASLVKDSTNAEKSFRQFANRVEAGSGKIVRFRDLQKDVQRVARQFSLDVDDVGLALENTFAETGDIEASRAVLEAVGRTTKVFGTDIEATSKLAGVLQQKFGLAANEVEAGLDIMVAAANRGGGSIEDFGEDFAEAAGKAKTLGLQGTDGVKKMAGFLNLAKRETGNFQQAMTALPQIFDQIIERTSKGVVKSSGKVPIKVEAVDKDGKPRDPFDIINDIIKETGGDAEKLGEFGFGGEGLQTLLAIAKPFAEELEATGGDVEAARRKLDDSLNEAAGSALDFNKKLQKAGERSGADAFQDSINIIKEAFTQPEMIASINSLAKDLPALAGGIAKAIAFIVDNPALSAGVFAGGIALKGAATGAITSAISGAFATGGTTAAGTIGKAIATQGGVAGQLMGGAIAAAAALAIGLAVDQAFKLAEDLKTDARDQVDERENLLGIEEKRGGDIAERNIEGFFGDTTEFITRNSSGQAIPFETRAAAASQAQKNADAQRQNLAHIGVGEAERPLSADDLKSNVDFLTGKRGAVPGRPGEEDPTLFFDRIERRAEAQSRKGGRPLTKSEGERLDAGEDPASVIKSSMKPVVTALKALTTTELRVRITNPEDIKSSGKKKTGADDVDD